MRLKRFAVSLLAAALLTAQARAAFQVPIATPDQAAMGYASLSAHPGSQNLFANPAQIAGMRQPDAYFMYDQLYAGLQGVGTIGQQLVSAGVPTKYGTFGVGVGLFSASGLYEERTIAVTYARRFGERVMLGISGKQLYHSYQIGGDPMAAVDPVFQSGHAASAFAVDLGAAVKVSAPVTLGLTVRNINSPNLGLATRDTVPREVQGGLAYDFPADKRLRLTADVTYRDGNYDRTLGRITPAIGLEKGFPGDRFVFRLGLTSLEATAGFGLRWGSFGIDYALVLRRTLLDGNVGTHMLGLRWYFGGVNR